MSDAVKIWAVIPVKHFAAAKSRLAPMLSIGERATLARLMFEDVLDSVMQCNGALAGTLVVTSDDAAGTVARARGAAIVGDAGAIGINAAVSRAVRGVTGNVGVVVVPSDIPQVSPHTIMMAADVISAPRTLAIAAAAQDGGTNLLACRPAAAMPLCFGPQSFDRHRRAAAQAGLAVRQLSTSDLALDIDRPADLGAFLALNSKTRTHAFLSGLGLQSRPEDFPRISGVPELTAVGARHDG
jgi:2-phospho-L-lactate guanylyltransferase